MRFRHVGWGLLLSIVLVASVKAEGIRWYTDADDAWTEVDQAGRPLMVLVTRQGCPFCVRMKNSTLADPLVVQVVNAEFVALRVDQQEDPAFVRDLGIKAFPTLLIISPDDKLVDRVKGYMNADQTRQRLENARRATTAQRSANRSR
jgi:thioredoxin-related protein